MRWSEIWTVDAEDRKGTHAQTASSNTPSEAPHKGSSRTQRHQLLCKDCQLAKGHVHALADELTNAGGDEAAVRRHCRHAAHDDTPRNLSDEMETGQLFPHHRHPGPTCATYHDAADPSGWRKDADAECADGFERHVGRVEDENDIRPLLRRQAGSTPKSANCWRNSSQECCNAAIPLDATLQVGKSARNTELKAYPRVCRSE